MLAYRLSACLFAYSGASDKLMGSTTSLMHLLSAQLICNAGKLVTSDAAAGSANRDCISDEQTSALTCQCTSRINLADSPLEPNSVPSCPATLAVRRASCWREITRACTTQQKWRLSDVAESRHLTLIVADSM